MGPFDRSFQPGKRYSLILMLDVLEHLADAPAALAYAVELLEPEGVLMITVPAFRWLWTSHDDMNHHGTRYTKQTFARLADLAGMRIDTCRYFFHWLVPLKLAVRAKECLLTASPRRRWSRQALSTSSVTAFRGWSSSCGAASIPVAVRS